jgi:hypothetical protein
MLIRRPCTPPRGPRPLGTHRAGRDRGGALRFTTRVSEYNLFFGLHRWGFKGSKMPLTKTESDQDLDLGKPHFTRLPVLRSPDILSSAPPPPPLSLSLSLYLSLALSLKHTPPALHVISLLYISPSLPPSLPPFLPLPLSKKKRTCFAGR